jgi:hypothetical protein
MQRTLSGWNKKWAQIGKSFTFSTLTQFMSAFKINSLAQETEIPITFSNCTYNCFGTLFLAFKFKDKIKLADLGGDVRNFFDQGEVVSLCWLFREMVKWRNTGSRNFQALLKASKLQRLIRQTFC